MTAARSTGRRAGRPARRQAEQRARKRAGQAAGPGAGQPATGPEPSDQAASDQAASGPAASPPALAAQAASRQGPAAEEAAGQGGGRLPAALRWAVRLLAGEAGLAAAMALFLVYEDITGDATDLRGALFVTGYVLAAAGALGGLAYALSRCRPWARGPAVALQLMLLPVGYYLSTGGSPWFGVPTALLGLVVIGLLVAPSSTRTLGIRGNHAD